MNKHMHCRLWRVGTKEAWGKQGYGHVGHDVLYCLRPIPHTRARAAPHFPYVSRTEQHGRRCRLGSHVTTHLTLARHI